MIRERWREARTVLAPAAVLLLWTASCGERPASIEGKVLLEDREDHEGTQVYIPGTPYQAITDREGRFELPEVRTGDYELVARREGYREYRRTGIRARRGSPLRLIPFTLEAEDGAGDRGGLEGVVRLEDGGSPGGALVIVESISRLATADEAGSFAFGGLPGGNYTLVAVKAGYVAARQSAEVIPGATAELEPLVLAVAGGTGPGTPTGRIAGAVEVLGGGSRAGVLVTVEGSSLVASTNGEGRFSIAGVPSGTHAVRFQKDQYFPLRKASVAVERGSETELEVTLRPIPSENVFATLSQVEDVGAIRGSIRILGGGSVEGAEILLEPLGLTAEAEADGEYVFPAVPEGAYSVSARKAGYRSGIVIGVEVGTGEETTPPELVLEAIPEEELPPQPSQVAGTILLEGEQSHLGVLVAFVDSQYTAITGTDGRFRFGEVMPGEYELLAVKEGFEPLEAGVEVPAGGGDVMLRPMTLSRVIVRPAILDTEPRDGERDVPVEDFVQIVVQFDQRMDGESVKRAFRISPAASQRRYFGGEKGAESFRDMGPGFRQDFDAMLFVRNEEPPAAYDRLVVRLLRYGDRPVELGRKYRVTITDEAKNLEGASIAEPYEFSFTTGGARITGTWPEDGDSGVFILEDDALIFDFNASIDRGSFERAFRIRPKTDSVPIFLPERVPSGDRVKVELALRESTRYTVEIDRSVRTKGGERIENVPYRIRFETASIEDVGDDYEDLFEGEWGRSGVYERHLERRAGRDRRRWDRRAVREQEGEGY